MHFLTGDNDRWVYGVCIVFVYIAGQMVEFNVPLDTVYTAFRRRWVLSSDVHLPFSNWGPAT